MEQQLAEPDIGLLIAAILVVAGLALMSPVRSWLTARAAGVSVTLFALLMMRLRGTKPRRLLAPLIAASRAGLRLKLSDLEALHLAGGDVTKVVDAMILASENGIDLDFGQAVATDLAGRDLLQEIKATIRESGARHLEAASTTTGRTAGIRKKDDS